MASKASKSFEKDLTCSICHEVFTDPVTLKCEHNFCQKCVCDYWGKCDTQLCPVCRVFVSISDVKKNFTLLSLVHSLKKEPKAQPEDMCSEHEEKLKLFCLEDQELICLVCQTSERHQNHKFRPLKEAALHYKEEVKTALTSLQGTEKKLSQVKKKCDRWLKLLLDKSKKTEKEIKEDFLKLHQFLHEEEKNLLADLKKEKKEKEQKMREKIRNISKEMTSLSSKIKDIEKKMDQRDNDFLMDLRDMRERIKEYADYKPKEPEAVSAADIDGYKYTDCLQYRVWKKMLKIINPVTVTLDPNTAHPKLTVSEDLTAVTRGSTWRYDLPDNLERLDLRPCVLGSEGFTSGIHSWVVDVEKQTRWILGVAAESANRKGFIYLQVFQNLFNLNLRPERGYWTVILDYGGYTVFSNEGWTRLKVLKTPKKGLH
ncbi:zinc-binding protein A33-like isoform X2 [Latimeria chalumnae]|uniref:zinc-binding protein A33-like isoform X2 n=1 Tax=Latimeria chalumnae TaxID=7897 RepID=UPI00313CFC85